MTPTEKLAFVWIRQFIANNGYAPSHREIASAIGNRSTSNVGVILRSLQSQGKIDFVDGISRSITLTERDRIITEIMEVAEDVCNDEEHRDDNIEQLGRLLYRYDQETYSSRVEDRMEAISPTY